MVGELAAVVPETQWAERLQHARLQLVGECGESQTYQGSLCLGAHLGLSYSGRPGRLTPVLP